MRRPGALDPLNWSYCKLEAIWHGWWEPNLQTWVLSKSSMFFNCQAIPQSHHQNHFKRKKCSLIVVTGYAMFLKFIVFYFMSVFAFMFICVSQICPESPGEGQIPGTGVTVVVSCHVGAGNWTGPLPSLSHYHFNGLEFLFCCSVREALGSTVKWFPKETYSCN